VVVGNNRARNSDAIGVRGFMPKMRVHSAVGFEFSLAQKERTDGRFEFACSGINLSPGQIAINASLKAADRIQCGPNFGEC
jgi:hypothetical protein